MIKNLFPGMPAGFGRILNSKPPLTVHGGKKGMQTGGYRGKMAFRQNRQ
jgi:hypothetical protein